LCSPAPAISYLKKQKQFADINAEVSIRSDEIRVACQMLVAQRELRFGKLLERPQPAFNPTAFATAAHDENK
jgi:hypothetical protein